MLLAWVLYLIKDFHCCIYPSSPQVLCIKNLTPITPFPTVLIFAKESVADMSSSLCRALRTFMYKIMQKRANDRCIHLQKCTQKFMFICKSIWMYLHVLASTIAMNRLLVAMTAQHDITRVVEQCELL